MCVNNLSKVALDSAAAVIEPATSSRKSNALTTAPPSHTYARANFLCVELYTNLGVRFFSDFHMLTHSLFALKICLQHGWRRGFVLSAATSLLFMYST